MAKRGRRKGSKTAAIHKALTENPEATPKELAAQLTSRGVKVTPAYVSTIKSNLRREGGVAAAKVGRNGGDLSLEALRAAKQLADRLGGIAHAQKVLDALKSLQ